MSHPTLAKFQIGKNGITEGVLESLALSLKYHRQVRISVLKSACRNRDELNKMASLLADKLPVRNHRVIGYTIILIK